MYYIYYIQHTFFEWQPSKLVVPDLHRAHLKTNKLIRDTYKLKIKEYASF